MDITSDMTVKGKTDSKDTVAILSIKVTRLATKAPAKIPGKALLPRIIIIPRAKPEGGHIGDALLFSKAKFKLNLARI